jgi:hypothetical protein
MKMMKMMGRKEERITGCLGWENKNRDNRDVEDEEDNRNSMGRYSLMRYS